MTRITSKEIEKFRRNFSNLTEPLQNSYEEKLIDLLKSSKHLLALPGQNFILNSLKESCNLKDSARDQEISDKLVLVKKSYHHKYKIIISFFSSAAFPPQLKTQWEASANARGKRKIFYLEPLRRRERTGGSSSTTEMIELVLATKQKRGSNGFKRGYEITLSLDFTG